MAATLLFLVEPMVGPMALPAGVDSSMPFFQVTLLGGYAHAATTRISPGRRPWVHIRFELVPLLVLPIHLDVVPSGAGGAAPIRELQPDSQWAS